MGGQSWQLSPMDLRGDEHRLDADKDRLGPDQGQVGPIAADRRLAVWRDGVGVRGAGVHCNPWLPASPGRQRDCPIGWMSCCTFEMPWTSSPRPNCPKASGGTEARPRAQASMACGRRPPAGVRCWLPDRPLSAVMPGLRVTFVAPEFAAAMRTDAARVAPAFPPVSAGRP